MRLRNLTITAVCALGALFVSSVTLADHAWSTFHWARTANPFTLQVVDSTTPDWDMELGDSLAQKAYEKALTMFNEDTNITEIEEILFDA